MKNELVFNSCENCMTVAKILLEEGFVVMLSREEDLWILNFVYSEHSDRNDVVFMSQDEFGNKYIEIDGEEKNDESN